MFSPNCINLKKCIQKRFYYFISDDNLIEPFISFSGIGKNYSSPLNKGSQAGKRIGSFSSALRILLLANLFSMTKRNK